MTDKISPAQLKNRVLGAILLAILAVLIIPLFLGEPKGTALPPPYTGNDFQSKITPLPSSKRPKQVTNLVLPRTFQAKPIVKVDAPTLPKSKKAKPNKKQANKTTVKKQAPKPNKKSTPAPVTSPTKKTTTASNTDPNGSWALQAGIFSKKVNAEAIANILKSNGFSPKLGEFTASFGSATRVWVGPFKLKVDAQAESDKLKEKTGDGGYVASYPFEQ